VKEVGSGASERQLTYKLLDQARRREIDVVLQAHRKDTNNSISGSPVVTRRARSASTNRTS
jgi:hypothetical protein